MWFSLFCDLCTSRSCYALSMMLHSHSEDPPPINTLQTSACKFSVHKFQVALHHAHAVSKNICEPTMHASGPIHRENGYREIWGNIISKNNRYEWGLEPQFTLSFTHDLRNLIIQQDLGLECLFWSLLVCAFNWMSCMYEKGLHEATLPRTWIPVRRSWPHRTHRQNYGIRTESRKGFFTTSSQLDYIRVLLRWERPVGRSDREGPGWNPSFAPPAARDDWEQVGVVASGTCSFSS